MTRSDIERVLTTSLSSPPDPEELDEIVEQVLFRVEQAEQLRALPLEQEDAATPPVPEPQP